MNLPDRALGASALRLAAARGAAVALGVGLLTGCGAGTGEAALSPVEKSTSGDGIAPTAEPTPGDVRPGLGAAPLSCRSGEGVAGQTASAPNGHPRGKARPKLALAAIHGVDPARYQAVDRSPSSVRFIREDDRYSVTVIKFPNGTWFEVSRQYCVKSGQPVDRAPRP